MRCRAKALRAPLAAPWHAYLATLDPKAAEDEQAALKSARLFTAYLGPVATSATP